MEKLKVPQQWVYSAKVSGWGCGYYCPVGVLLCTLTSDWQAQRAWYDGNHRQQAMHLLKAGEWDHAHSVIVDHLAANDIISGEPGVVEVTCTCIYLYQESRMSCGYNYIPTHYIQYTVLVS